MTLKLRVKKLDKDAKLPIRKREGDAGLDLYSNQMVVLNPGERKIVSTGIAIEIPKGYVGVIKDRSGLAAKQGIITIAGVIDENYRGEVLVALYNINNQQVILDRHTRIAQMLIVPYLGCEVVEVEELSDTQRGAKGFGSSGLK